MELRIWVAYALIAALLLVVVFGGMYLNRCRLDKKYLGYKKRKFKK
jgi:uncharacterized protein YneF (UPF0154 family)